MRALRRFVKRLTASLRGGGDDDRVREELFEHLALLTEEYTRAGMPLDEARRQARLTLGSHEVTTEACRDEQRLRFLEDAWQDLRYAARTLRKQPTFTFVAVLTLALGIAGTTVMFTLIHGVLLRPLPMDDPDRLILAWREARGSDAVRYPFGDREIEAMAASSQLLQSAAGVSRNGVARSLVTEHGTSTYANVGFITGGFFDVLGVRAIHGRVLTVADDHQGTERVVVISHGYWHRRYGGTREILGRRIAIADQAFAIVGVMPADLDYPVGVDIWRTTGSLQPGEPWAVAIRREVDLIARLRPDVTVGQAEAELRSLNQGLRAAVPSEDVLRDMPVARAFVDVVVGDVRVTLMALLGAVGLVLLIASANVANLLLIRGESRRSELALRAALGAGRGRIVRQVLAESVVLSVAAGIAGFALAGAALPTLLTLMPEGFPRLESIRVDTTVGLFSSAVVCVTAILAGMGPALVAVRGDLVSPLRAGSPTVAGRSSARGPQILAMAQVALAVTVLAAAGLLIRSVLNLQTIDLGLAPERLVLVDLYMPPAGFADRGRRAQFLDEAITQLEAVPAVVAVTPVNVPPFTDRGWDVPRVAAEGQGVDRAAANPALNLESIHPNYFATLDVPIVRGRAFSSADREGMPSVAILSDDAAAQIWPDENPIGKRLKFGGADQGGPWLEVVGVAAPTRYRTVTTPRPTLYLPAAQFQMTASMLIVRVTASLERLMSVARGRIRTVDPTVQVMAMTPFSVYLDRPLARPRFVAFLLGTFGVVALLLSSLGLYGVIAARVRQREREIAVRLALGATSARVQRLVLREAFWLASLGALLGLGGAMVATRLLRGLLFGVHPVDPGTLVAAAALLVGAAAAASYVPVRRAARADVMSVLRSQ
ncbi:ADOP family duplicated permease [Luteitalea sp.]